MARTASFSEPRIELEQYPTPSDVAAQLCHLAAMRGDLAGSVVDLGAGTGRLALAAACHAPERVAGIEVDAAALRVARTNETRVEPPVPVSWVRGDATRPPLSRAAFASAEQAGAASDEPAGAASGVTVVANPPFGAQDGNRGADRAFLATAAELGGVSYTIHNGGSRSFVESFAADEGGRVTDAFGVELALANTFAHQTDERRTIDAEAYRIVWS